jgi:hypothetical protein
MLLPYSAIIVAEKPLLLGRAGTLEDFREGSDPVRRKEVRVG